MNKKHATIFFGTILFVLVSCHENKSNEFSVKLDEPNNTLSLFDLFSNVTPIFLETNEDCLIRSICEIKYVNEFLYILDTRTNAIFIFDPEGNYISKIDQQGEGPGQYFHICSFTVRGDTIDTLAPVNNAIYSFDHSGNLLEKKRLPDIVGAYMDFAHLTNNITAFWTFDYHNRLKYYSHSKEEFILETFPEPRMYEFGGDFSQSDILGRNFTNIVYMLQEEGPVELFYWDFGETNNSEKMIRNVCELAQLSQSEETFGEALKNREKITNSELVHYVFRKHLSNSSYQYAGITHQNRFFNLFWNKKEKNYLFFEKTKENVTLYPIYMDEHMILGSYERGWEEILNPDFLSLADRKKLSQYDPETDNPIIVNYNFRNL